MPSNRPSGVLKALTVLKLSPQGELPKHLAIFKLASTRPQRARKTFAPIWRLPHMHLEVDLSWRLVMLKKLPQASGSTRALRRKSSPTIPHLPAPPNYPA